MNLQIQCPKCSKRFTIHEDLTGKTVECGSCDHRFPVKSESIIVEKPRVYPGEQKGDDFFNRLGRQPGKAATKAERVRAAALVPKVDAIMPASPGRNIAVGVGMAILILYGLLFLAGTSKGGSFQDMGMIRRVILTSFVSLVGAPMVIYGAKNWRFQATMMAMVLVLALAALTVIRPVMATPEVTDVPVSPRRSMEQPAERELSDVAIKERVGYEAVERKLKEMEQRFGAAAPDHLVAIFIEDLQPGQFFNLEKYFKRAFNMPVEEAVNQYKRNGERDSLIVISGFEIGFEEAVRACDPRLGQATTYPALRLIDLKLSAIHTTKVSEDLMKTLGNPANRGFYAMNLKELGALDPERVQNAVRNLSTVPAEIELQYQDQIVTEFMQLLNGQTDKVVLMDLARAFRRWAAGNPAALVVVSRKVETWLEEEVKVHPDFVEFLIENKEPRALAFVDELWSKEPELWVNQYRMIGPMAETRLIEHLDGPTVRLRHSAASILGAIGTELSLPTLEKFRDASDEELKIIVARAIQAIKER